MAFLSGLATGAAQTLQENIREAREQQFKLLEQSKASFEAQAKQFQTLKQERQRRTELANELSRTSNYDKQDIVRYVNGNPTKSASELLAMLQKDTSVRELPAAQLDNRQVAPVDIGPEIPQPQFVSPVSRDRGVLQRIFSPSPLPTQTQATRFAQDFGITPSQVQTTQPQQQAPGQPEAPVFAPTPTVEGPPQVTPTNAQPNLFGQVRRARASIPVSTELARSPELASFRSAQRQFGVGDTAANRSFDAYNNALLSVGRASADTAGRFETAEEVVTSLSDTFAPFTDTAILQARFYPGFETDPETGEPKVVIGSPYGPNLGQVVSPSELRRRVKKGDVVEGSEEFNTLVEDLVKVQDGINNYIANEVQFSQDQSLNAEYTRANARFLDFLSTFASDDVVAQAQRDIELATAAKATGTEDVFTALKAGDEYVAPARFQTFINSVATYANYITRTRQNTGLSARLERYLRQEADRNEAIRQRSQPRVRTRQAGTEQETPATQEEQTPTREETPEEIVDRLLREESAIFGGQVRDREDNQQGATGSRTETLPSSLSDYIGRLRDYLERAF